MLNRSATAFLISTAFLTVFVIQFISRTADNNSLFSWEWVFATADAASTYSYLIAGLAAAFYFSRLPVPEQYHIPLLFFITFASIIPLWQQPEIIVDASRYFSQAKHFSSYGMRYFLHEWGNAIQAWTDLPLIPFLYGLLFMVFGEHRYAVQMFTTVLFALTSMLTYVIGRLLWNSAVGFSAGLLLLGIPYLMTQVPLMLVDVPTMFFLMLSIYTFLKAMDVGGVGWIAGSATVIVCTVLTKYSTWFMLTVLIIALMVRTIPHWSAGNRRPAQRGAVVLLIAGAISGILLLGKYDLVHAQLGLLREYQQPGLYRWGENYISTFLFQVHPFITLAAIVGFSMAVRKRDWNIAIVSWLLLLMAVFSIKRIRYTLPIFPLVTLMAGYALNFIKSDEHRRFVVYGMVSTSLVIVLSAYLPFASRMSDANLKHAGAYLDTLDTAEIEVFTLQPGDPVANPAISIPLLDLYTNKQLHYAYHPDEPPAAAEVQLSPLRFTWDFRNPPYYAVPSNSKAPQSIVVISDVQNDSLPVNLENNISFYRLTRSFMTTEGVFRHSVGIRVFERIRDNTMHTLE